MSNTADEDVVMESSSSGPATPLVSNPGTPRSEVEVRNTPPPAAATALAAAAAASGSSQQSVTMPVPAAVATPPNSSTALAYRGNSQVQHPAPPQQPQSKYGQLLNVIEDMGKDIRPTYSGSKSSAERLKRGIVHARILVRECLMECERSART